MKISIEKIAKYKVEILKYYSDDIFSFILIKPDLYEQRLQQFKEQYSNENTNFKDIIDRECIKNSNEQLGNSEFFMELNMKHVYNADTYFTNGQKIISTIQSSEGFEIGIHKDLNTFSNYFYDTPALGQFSLINLRPEKYKVFEKVESEIVKILSKIETIRIPIEHDSDRDFIEIRQVYPSTYYFSSNNRTIVRKTEYNGDWIDKISDEVFDSFKLINIKCCKNCKYFQFSGMSHDMSGGFTGYCNLIKTKLEEITVQESTTNIWNWCSKFETK